MIDYKFSVGERVVICVADQGIGIAIGTKASIVEVNTLDVGDIYQYRVNILSRSSAIWVSDEEISRDLEYYRNEVLNKIGI